MASKRQNSVDSVKISSGAPVVVQSMTTTKTHDVEATAHRSRPSRRGYEIVRVAVTKTEDAVTLSKIVHFSPVGSSRTSISTRPGAEGDRPGVAAVRIDPGNISGSDKVAEVVRAAKAEGTPMRIGANPARCRRPREAGAGGPGGGVVEAALEEVRLLESLDFYDFRFGQVEPRPDDDSRLPDAVQEGRVSASSRRDQAGTVFAGSIKSAVGIGTLLAEGIGDTIRVSLSSDPVEEPKTAYEILKSLGLRERGPVMIACPSCGRDNVGVHTLAEEVELRLEGYPQHFEVAVLGCAVNGPGESGDADFGIAGGRDVGFIYAHGRVLKKVSSDILIDELFHEIDRWIADGMHRPKRLKMAKPAALAMAEASLIPLE